MADPIYDMLAFIVDLFTLIVILIISVILLIRIIKEKKWNKQKYS